MDTISWGYEQDLDAEKGLSVLVAVVPRLDDWGHIVNEGWYHIPAARAPQRIAVDRLAFYHPLCFPASAHTVSYYADVRDYELLPRSALFPEQLAHPRAHELYYRLNLGPVLPLPWPIPAARLRRITFIRTNWSLLLQAQDVVELWPRDSLPARLARELRDLARPYLCPLPTT
jgi:hypothetical protein